jgi:DNA-binding NtrC family response regulator
MARAEDGAVSVLVVDDEAAICRIVTRTLERNGFLAKSVSVAANVRSALEVESFDVVLLDRSMENPEGGPLLDLVRRLAPQAKVLFFTGEYVDPEEVERVDGVVQKPINGAALAEALRRVLG